MRTSSILTAGALVASAAAENYLGFNSGAKKADESAKFKKDFVAEFEAAQNLKNAPGDFNAVRLYTNIQAYAEDDPIEAFEAAIDTNTHILLGVWASDTDNIDKELTALEKAVDQYGKKFTDLVIGISIGSEDLYRVSATGIKNKSGPGNSPDAIVGFIKDFRDAFEGTGLGDIPVGHVDTWDVWPNTTNKAVIDAVDFIGVNSFPYYEGDENNDIKNSGHLFDRSYETTLNAVGGKPVWVTETGWPASGPDWEKAEASVKNAKYYWNEIGCRQLFGKVNTFWYILRDSNSENTMKFGIDEKLTGESPLFDLSCPSTFDTESSSSAAPSATPTTTTGTATSTPSPTSSSSPASTSASDSDSNSDESDDSEDSEDSDDSSSSGNNNSSGSNGSDNSNSSDGSDSNDNSESSNGSDGSNGSDNSDNSSSDSQTDSQNEGSEESTEEDPEEAGAMSIQSFTTVTYALLALTAGVFTLF